jgi:hypothetical protein
MLTETTSEQEQETVTLIQALERQIVQRTWGRLHQLAVEQIEGRLIVRGCAPSYYVKQLTIQAVLETLAAAGALTRELTVDIRVLTPRVGHGGGTPPGGN